MLRTNSTEFAIPINKNATTAIVGRVSITAPILGPNLSATVVAMATAKPPIIKDNNNCNKKSWDSNDRCLK